MKIFFVLMLCMGVALAAFPSNVSTLLESYGYPVYNHEVVTEDGYVLPMQEVRTGESCRGAVLFQHGLLDCAIGITLNAPPENLIGMLADRGLCVFLGANRGDGYVMRSVRYATDSDEFWAFSFDEMARYDLPAQIRFALDRTSFAQLTYIGHSEGTIQAFAGFLNHTVASWVNRFVALAPVARVGHQRSLFLSILAALDTADILHALGVREFSLSASIHALAPNLCKLDPSLCESVMAAIAGPTNHLNASREYFYVHYLPAPTSVTNMVHWSQLVKSGAFQMYDYGTQGNLAKYGQPTPPLYDLSQFPASLPVAFYAGGEDYLADPDDVAWLRTQMPHLVVNNVQPSYAHLDFLWATDAHTGIYLEIVEDILRLSALPFP